MSAARVLGSRGKMSATRYRLVLHRAALAELKALPAKVRIRVQSAIDSLAEVPFPPEAARLKGRPNGFRLRFGDYRLLYEVHATEIVVYVVGVAHRREVYQRLLRRR